MAIKICSSPQFRYLVYTPVEYDTKTHKTWPLLLYLHGAGSNKSSDIQRIGNKGPLHWVSNGNSLQFVIVAPHAEDGQKWRTRDLMAFLNHIGEILKINMKQVCITGVSMGAYGVWSLLLEYPSHFVAAAPIAGAASTTSIAMAPKFGSEGAALRQLNVWAVHGAEDTDVPLAEVEKTFLSLQRIGCTNTKLTIHPNAAHDVWTCTYNDPTFYEWLDKCVYHKLHE